MTRVRTTSFQKRKQADEKITMLTAYDYPTARILDATDIDAILVGDSVGTTVQGHADCLGVTMDMMIYHTKLVSSAVQRALVIGDMPFMSYQTNPEEALRNAGRFIAEGGAQAIKLEGGAHLFGDTIKAILRAGIPVMGHIGLTPQSIHQLGGYKVQGRGEEAARSLREQALGLQTAGCFAVVLELVQADVARAISELLTIPTIGIGSGVGCDGQVLVTHDLLGIGKSPKFVKRYCHFEEEMSRAFNGYIGDVKSGAYPAEEHEHK